MTLFRLSAGLYRLANGGGVRFPQEKVVGVDVNQHAVDTINRGAIHIVEPDLDKVVKDAVDGGFLQAVTKPLAADAFLIAVPTPFRAITSRIWPMSKRRRNRWHRC